MIVSLLIPSVVLMAAAVFITRGIERIMPESVPGLVLTGLLAALTLWLMSGALFGWLYIMSEALVAPYLGTGRGLGHLASMGGKAALIWLPLVLITVVTAPRRWQTNTW